MSDTPVSADYRLSLSLSHSFALSLSHSFALLCSTFDLHTLSSFFTLPPPQSLTSSHPLFHPSHSFAPSSPLLYIQSSHHLSLSRFLYLFPVPAIPSICILSMYDL